MTNSTIILNYSCQNKTPGCPGEEEREILILVRESKTVNITNLMPRTTYNISAKIIYEQSISQVSQITVTTEAVGRFLEHIRVI